MARSLYNHASGNEKYPECGECGVSRDSLQLKAKVGKKIGLEKESPIHQQLDSKMGQGTLL